MKISNETFTIDDSLKRFKVEKFATDRFDIPVEVFTSNLLKIGLSFKSDFVIDKWNKDFYNELYFWFFNNKKTSLDLSKGLYIKSNIGRGKSIALMIFEVLTHWYKQNNKNYNKNFVFKEVLQCVQDYRENKAIIEKSDRIICYNDLGRESITEDKSIMMFGEKCIVMNHIIEVEYLKFQRKGIPCIITSNWGFDKIKEWYGVETLSRFKEMFNFLELKGNDRRKI